MVDTLKKTDYIFEEYQIDEFTQETSENKFLNILTDRNKLNNKRTKLKEVEDYKYLYDIIKELSGEEFINFFRYLSAINYPILEILINGYIEFNDDSITEEIILGIISNAIYIYFDRNIFYFVYKKLSKYYRRNQLLKDIKSIVKFEKLINIWKLLYNTSSTIDLKDWNDNSFLFFPNLIKEKKYIEIEIDDKNEIRNLIIEINFLCSPIFNLNNAEENYSFIKLYDENNEIFEMKYNDFNLNKNDKEINFSFSKIRQIKFYFSANDYNILINNYKKIESKKDIKYNFNNIKKIELLNNFIGDISSIIIEKQYAVMDKYEETNTLMIEPLKMEIKKEKDNLKITTNAFNIKTENKNDENMGLLFYQYCGASYNVKISSENFKYYRKRINVNLDQIEYFGGLNCLIPMFKIITNAFKNHADYINSQNTPDGNDKYELLINPEDSLNRILALVKEIIKIMLKMICLSENNFKNFKKIIVPLLGTLGEISHMLNDLYKSNLIGKNHISFLFGDEVFSTLYILILLSTFPFNIKIMYRKIVGINDNLDNLKLSLDSILSNKDIFMFNNGNWYLTILIMYIEFILIYFNSSEKVPAKLIKQTKLFLDIEENENNSEEIKAIKTVIKSILGFYQENKIIQDSIMTEDKNFVNDNNSFFQFIIYMLSTYLNIKSLLKINKIEFDDNSFYSKYRKLFENYFSKKDKINITDDYVQMIIAFVLFTEDIQFLQSFFPFLYDENFINDNELIMEELIDYHGQYHKLMKDLFIFNRFWSNKKLFFNDSLERLQNSNLKYKSINYYTRNFQRPIIYPVLDYKYRYPDFTKFKIDKDFYIKLEEKDDYNFDLDCPELDDYIQEYNEEIYNKIVEKGKINICEVCLVKQTYHVKGKLFIFYQDNKIRIYFYSYPIKFQNNEEEFPCCNRENEEVSTKKNKNKNNLCYGSILKCPKKDGNIKIKIYFEEIRLILSRIYFYRQSAMEIFTETKSYYFNFCSEVKKNDLFLTFIYPCGSSMEYFPININGDVIGYMKLNKNILEKKQFDELINEKDNFINFFSNQTSKDEFCEMCVFDIIMLINLISNRSYNDLYQYPVFPLLYFYNKKTGYSVNRNLKEHIGFQEITENSKIRKDLFLKVYKETVNEIKENTENNSENNIDLHCFNTHYSNSIYTSNFLLRLFPYSFSSIELQGNGFDDPNRLFYSIDETFNNIATQKSDLRELIPEFFYLPEMFMNLNSINFHRRSNGELVDDVIMPKNSSNKRYISNNNDEDSPELMIKDSNIKESDYLPKKKLENLKKCFAFTEHMKNLLENLKDFPKWLNIIFGLNQKVSPKNRQYFRKESYINNNNEENNKYVKDDIIMSSVEFGIIPLQTIYNQNILYNLQKRKNEYELYHYENKNKRNSQKPFSKGNGNSTLLNSKNCQFNEVENNFMNISIKKSHNEESNNNSGEITYNVFKKESNDYWDEHLKLDFKIYNNNGIGKLEIYVHNILIKEVIDHNDKIIDFFYNRRLNMFATTSFDGFAFIYILPSKLFCALKHPNNLYFDKIFLSANPFPTIITYEEKSCTFRVYSLSGILIRTVTKDIKFKEKINIKIKPIFNTLGGAYKDKINITFKKDKTIINEYYNLPFFEFEHKEIDFI